MLVRHGEDIQQPHRVRLEEIIAGQRDPPAFQNEPVQLLGPAED